MTPKDAESDAGFGLTIAAWRLTQNPIRPRSPRYAKGWRATPSKSVPNIWTLRRPDRVSISPAPGPKPLPLSLPQADASPILRGAYTSCTCRLVGGVPRRKKGGTVDYTEEI